MLKTEWAKGSSLACGHPTNTEERPVMLQEGVGSIVKPPPPKPAARSSLIIAELGPSASALAAASGGRLRRPAAERHAARCASRALCSGGAPWRYSPSQVRYHGVAPSHGGGTLVAYLFFRR